MNDKKLEEFLTSNSRVPAKPANEWPEILSKIENSRPFLTFREKIRPKQIGVSLAVIVVLAVFGSNFYTSQQVEIKVSALENIEQFLADDSFFEDTQEEYTWVANL